jgi:hypothetical protein
MDDKKTVAIKDETVKFIEIKKDPKTGRVLEAIEDLKKKKHIKQGMHPDFEDFFNLDDLED